MDLGRESAWAALRTEYLELVTRATARSRRRSRSVEVGGMWEECCCGEEEFGGEDGREGGVGGRSEKSVFMMGRIM